MGRNHSVEQNTMVGKPSVTARSTVKSMGKAVNFSATPGGDMPRQESFSAKSASGMSAPGKGSAWSREMNGTEYGQKSSKS